MSRKTKSVVIFVVIIGTVVFIMWRRHILKSIATDQPVTASVTNSGVIGGGSDGAVAPPETPVSGRWVRVQRVRPFNEENYVQIAQIIPYDENGNRIYVGIGSIVPPYQHGAGKDSYLWDNNRDSTAITDNAPDAYCEIDIGQLRKISRVDVWNRRDCCGARIIGTKMVVLDETHNPVVSYAFEADKPEYRIKLFRESSGFREI
jgi:hypothetical protein